MRFQDGEPRCLLCGRDPTSAATVGTLYQRREHKESQVAQLVSPMGDMPATESQARDPYLSLARKVLDYPEAESVTARQEF